MVTCDEILAMHPEAIRSLSSEVRELVRTTLSTVRERAYPGGHAIGFRDPDAGHICTLFPFDDRLELVFEHGHRLTDPDGLLEGTDFKKVRYHVLRPGQPARRAELQRLLLAALHDSSLHQRLPRRRKK